MGKWSFGFHSGELLEDGLAEAQKYEYDFIEFLMDHGPNALETFDDARIKSLRALSDSTGVQMGLHTSSGTNMAEIAPFARDAIDRYLEAAINLAANLNCTWVIVHGGYYFSTHKMIRMEAAVEKLKRASELAEKKNVTLLFENHNAEPEHAEIKYFPFNVEESKWFMDRLPSSRFQWAFNVAHCNLVPEGVQGFIDEFGTDRIGQVRVADNTGEYEIHLPPGQGNIDFDQLFASLEEHGWKGPVILSFQGPEERLAWRNEFLAKQ